MSVADISSKHFSSASEQMESISEMGREWDPQVAASSDLAKFSPMSQNSKQSFVKSLCSALCSQNEKKKKKEPQNYEI